MKRMLIALMCATTAGCFSLSRASYTTFAHDDDEAVAQSFMEHMRNGEVAAARAMLAPGVDKASDEMWETMLGVMASADVSAAYLVGAHTSYGNSKRAARLVYEGPREDGHFIAQMDLADGLLTDATFWHNQTTMAEANRFGSQPLSPTRVFVLVLGLVSFAFSLFTFSAVLRSDISARRRWALLSLAGAVAISLEWTSGQAGLQSLSIKLPVFLVARAGPDAPWLFTAMLPVGALLAAERLRRHRHSAGIPAAENESGPAETLDEVAS